MLHPLFDKYKTLLDISPVAMVIYDCDMRIVACNDEFVRLSRLPSSAIGQVLYDVAPATSGRRQLHESVLAGKSLEETNVPHKFPDESFTRCSDIRYRPLYDEGGDVIGILSTVIDVTERMQVKQELHTLLSHKDDFLDLSAHELRTPITVIKAFAQLAQREEFRDQLPWLNHAFDVISRHADHLVHLVNDMIEVSRIGQSALPLYKEKFDLCELASELDVAYAPIFQRCTCNISLPAQPALVNADRNRIGTVFANIIDNAGKYIRNEQACKIDIALAPKGKEVVASVRDNGIGIPAGEQDKIFDRFFRGSNAGTRSRNGLGLGLYICKSIIEQHEGRIWVESEEDKGTVFHFALPAASA